MKAMLLPSCRDQRAKKVEYGNQESETEQRGLPVVHRLTVHHLPESWHSAHQGGRHEDFLLHKKALVQQ